MRGWPLATDAGEESLARAGAAPIRLRREDSLYARVGPVPSATSAMVLLLIGSLALHGMLMMAAVVATRSPHAVPSQEIAVEIVRDVPVPKPPPPKAEPAKLKPVEFAASKPAAKEPVSTKLPPPPSRPPLPERKPAPPLTEAARREPPKPVPVEARREPPKPAPVPHPSPSAKPAPTADESKDMADLKRELAELRAQQAALKAESAGHSPALPPVAGPLAGSMQAIALPGIGDGDGETVSYQELVFSQLAKAKGIGEYHGQAGTTGVRFEVDTTGRLISAEVAVSSGNEALDAEALAIVRRAAPFPPPPKDADHSFYANVNFVPAKG